MALGLRLSGFYYNFSWTENDFYVYVNSKYVVAPSSMLSRFYYNLFWIEKCFNIYLNSKYVIAPGLRLDADFFMCRLVVMGIN